MRATKFLLAVFAGGIVLFVIGGLIYEVILRNYLIDRGFISIAQSTPIMWSMVLAKIVSGSFITFVFWKRADILTFRHGLRAGAFWGFFIGVGNGFESYGMRVITLEYAVLDAVVWIVAGALAGGVVARVLSMGITPQEVVKSTDT